MNHSIYLSICVFTCPSISLIGKGNDGEKTFYAIQVTSLSRFSLFLSVLE